MEQQPPYGNMPPDEELVIPSDIRVRSDISWFEKVVIASLKTLPPGKGKHGTVAEYIALYLSAPVKSVSFVLASLLHRKIIAASEEWFEYVPPISS